MWFIRGRESPALEQTALRKRSLSFFSAPQTSLPERGEPGLENGFSRSPTLGRPASSRTEVAVPLVRPLRFRVGLASADRVVAAAAA